MLQALAALFGAIFTGVACCALGRLILVRTGWRSSLQSAEEWPLGALLGAAALHLSMFVIFALYLAYWPVIVGVLAIFIGLALRTRGQAALPASPRLPKIERTIALCIALPFLVLYVVNAWAPEFSPDGSAYHLGILARYLRARGFEQITTNMYAALGGGVEMVFAPAFVIGRHSAAALTHLLFAVAGCFAIFAFGARIGRPTLGTAAAVLFWVTPVLGRDATIAYTDAGAAAAIFAAFYWIELWRRSANAALLWPAGIMAGYAFAIKFTAVSIVVFGFVTVLLVARAWRPLVKYSAAVTLMAGPWLLRNWIWYRNPLAPLANKWFPNPYFHISAQDDWASWLRHYDLGSPWKIPWELTAVGYTLQGLLGPFFVLAPIALLALRNSDGRRILLAGAFVLATYPANIGARFLIPALPFVLLGMGMAISNSRYLLLGAVLIHGVLSWPNVVKLYADQAWRVYLFPIRAALRLESPDSFLAKNSSPYREARMVEANVPKGESVFALSGIADAYTTREVRTYYQSASNWDLADTFHMGWNAATQPLAGHVFSFASLQAEGVRLVMTKAAEGQWSLHELQVFQGGTELPRNPQWKLRAHPNPWQVQYIFDNTLVTRWRTWEATPAGSSIEVDFDHPQPVDEVRAISSPDLDWTPVKLQIKIGGQWQDPVTTPKLLELGEPRQIRREAVHELALRGIHYILIHPDDPGYVDVAEDPEGWGLRKIADTGGVVLYRTIW